MAIAILIRIYYSTASWLSNEIDGHQMAKRQHSLRVMYCSKFGYEYRTHTQGDVRTGAVGQVLKIEFVVAGREGGKP